MKGLRFSLVVLSVCAAGWLAPGLLRAQQPVPMDAETEDAVTREVNEFYRAYWRAWKDRDLGGVSGSLAEDFLLLTYVPEQGALQISKETAVETTRRFFDAVRGQEALWNFRLLSLLLRSETEVVTMVRSNLSWLGGGGEVEMSLEVLRKGPGGKWQLVRKMSERRPH